VVDLRNGEVTGLGMLALDEEERERAEEVGQVRVHLGGRDDGNGGSSPERGAELTEVGAADVLLLAAAARVLDAVA
jgi:hypothetical protein